MILVHLLLFYHLLKVVLNCTTKTRPITYPKQHASSDKVPSGNEDNSYSNALWEGGQVLLILCPERALQDPPGIHWDLSAVPLSPCVLCGDPYCRLLSCICFKLKLYLLAASKVVDWRLVSCCSSTWLRFYIY